MLTSPPKLRTCLWFHDRAREAAEVYVTLLPDSRIDEVSEVDGSVVVVELTLANVPYQFLQAGSHFTLTPAASISVLTEDQAETDRLWDKLSDGGEESMCGWLTDRFGVSWQIVPRRLLELQGGPGAEAVRAAMFKMKKIEIAALEAAAA
ncbi:VOC family protein [Roseovarius atlanticus]|uniref:VOC family protein n=1 Tax=Roseovarius atlanticus TaxID=1641875 RepID=UPI001C93EC05|nr:VOC family protein [Roseovarius atlanticus]MBY5989050.1 VOC family protein [Roseovarius atlanticus]MBY6124442.1 VOC family protein [Roseovarius atlanticus]MBY6148937.1 VOC family protein [Roseovarius atlanticus]